MRCRSRPSAATSRARRSAATRRKSRRSSRRRSRLEPLARSRRADRPWRARAAGRVPGDRDRAGRRSSASASAGRRAARRRAAGDRVRAPAPCAGAVPRGRCARRKLSARSTTSSAAFEGVAARTSATKSAIVKSTSWPTAAMTGHRTGRDGAGQRFVIERPEILGRSAAASDDDHVELRHARDGPQRAHQIERRAVALHAGGPDDDACGRMPRGQHAQDVAERGAVERRHHADAAGQHGQRPLARRVEQALRLQAPFQLLEGGLQCRRARAARARRRPAGTRP